MSKKSRNIEVKGSESTVLKTDRKDFISITDIARHKNPEVTGLVISHWLSTRYTIEFMELWDKMHNPDLNVTEFCNIKNESGSNGFVLSNCHEADLDLNKNWKTNIC